jgi:DNA-binding MarR family transcriptional regulator
MLDSFFKGYRGKAEPSPAQEPAKASPLDILDLFTALDVNSMSSIEIASYLMISNTEVIRLCADLVKKELIQFKKQPQGDYLVELTSRGRQLTK